MSIQEILDAGLKGVLDAPNYLRRKADELGGIVYGVLGEESARLEAIARPRAEEFYSARAGSKAGTFFADNRGLITTAALILLGLFAGAFFFKR